MPQLRLWIGLLTLGAVGAVRPVVLLHGLNSGAGAMSLTQSWIEADFPGIYVNNVEIGAWVCRLNPVITRQQTQHVLFMTCR